MIGPTVLAADAKGHTVQLAKGDDAPVWARVTTCRESGGFVTLGFRHAAYGSTTVTVPRTRPLPVRDPEPKRGPELPQDGPGLF